MLLRHSAVRSLVSAMSTSKICPGVVLRYGYLDHLMSFKERVLHASHFCDLYWSCASTEIISEAPFLDFLIFNSKTKGAGRTRGRQIFPKNPSPKKGPK